MSAHMHWQAKKEESACLPFKKTYFCPPNPLAEIQQGATMQVTHSRMSTMLADPRYQSLDGSMNSCRWGGRQERAIDPSC